MLQSRLHHRLPFEEQSVIRLEEFIPERIRAHQMLRYVRDIGFPNENCQPTNRKPGLKQHIIDKATNRKWYNLCEHLEVLANETATIFTYVLRIDLKNIKAGLCNGIQSILKHG